jgi:energy-coupling factor transport system permease protein
MLTQFLNSLVARTMIGYVIIYGVPALLPALFVKVIGFKGLRHLFSYEPKQSVIHALDPRLKVIYPVLMGTLSIFLNWDYVYLLVGFALLPWILLRPSAKRLRVVITMVAIPVIGLIWAQGLFHTIGNGASPNTTPHDLIYVFPPTLSWVGTPGLSASGLLFGVQQSGRTMAGVLAALVLLFTTTPSEVVWAFHKFRLPAQAGLAFSAALRFLPQMMERLTVLLQVVQVRGYDLTVPRWWEVRQWPGYLWRVCACIPVVTIPLLIAALRTTSVMAMVVDARGFGSHAERQTLRQHRRTLADTLALGLLLGLTLAVIVLVVLHIGNRGIYS